ncbi:MAG TPA: ABC transporter ATP-binding protein [Rhodocyclaceae bacterium]
MSEKGILEVRSLGKRIDTGGKALVILDDVSFSVTVAESVAIVGASGSGKSTLLGLLAGLDTPSSGEVWVDGENLSALDEDARASLRGRLLGFVFQSFQLLPALTALDNVMLPLELAGQSKAAETAREWLGRVGLSARAHHLPRELSGGEQQRVALARAFCTNPRLVLADEPTGNLDAATGTQIIDLMFSLNAELKTTLVLVTHDEAIAARCARRLRMVEGRLFDEGEAPRVGLKTGLAIDFATKAVTID